MKKLSVLAAAMLIVLASCGNKGQNNTAVAGQDSIVADTSAVGTASNELSAEQQATVNNLTAELSKAINAKDAKGTITTLANLQTIYRNLVEQGRLDEAKAYGSAVKKFVEDNAATLKNITSGNATVASLVKGIANLPTSAEATAEEAKAAVTSDAVSLANAAIAKGETSVATAKAAADMVKNAPAAVKNAAENAAKSAVENAATTAEKTAASAVNKANEKATEAVNAEKKKAADKINAGKQKANDAVNKAANKALKDLGL